MMVYNICIYCYTYTVERFCTGMKKKLNNSVLTARKKCKKCVIMVVQFLNILGTSTYCYVALYSGKKDSKSEKKQMYK